MENSIYIPAKSETGSCFMTFYIIDNVRKTLTEREGTFEEFKKFQQIYFSFDNDHIVCQELMNIKGIISTYKYIIK